MEAVGRLAGGVAHDFNNILTVVRASTDFLLMDLPQASDLNEEIQTIRESVERASRLTRQLLAFSREQVLRPQVLNVNEILGEMEKLLFRILGEDIRIETRLDPDLPPIRVDPGQVEQVIMNLVVNARDAMPEGGSLLLATAREDVDEQTAAIEPGLEPGPVVSITVSDTGQGIDADDLHRIFEPFFSTKRETGGTGLGLATSYGIVMQSGGNIHVESEPGVGTTFVIRFPLAEGPPREARSKAAEDLKGEGVTGTVLIVEDDENVRRAIRRGLERAGFEVRTAGDAETAMGILDEDAVDLLVTDLVLPGMRGTELARRAKATHPGLGVVAMSGYAKGRLSGPESIPEEMAFIKKPFSPNALVERIREELNKEREE